MLALFNFPDNFRQQRSKPFAQRAVRAIPNSQPDNHRRFPALPDAAGEIFVFGQNHRVVFDRVPPNRRIFRFAQTNFFDMFGLMPLLAQPARQCRRQLSINDEFHRAYLPAAMRTG